MSLSVSTGLLLAFMLASVRITAWLVVAPPFSSPTVPRSVRVLLGVALGVLLAPSLASRVPEPTTAGLIGATAVQVVVGLALGFLTSILFAAVQSAGDLLDLFGGFSLAQGFDPLGLNQNAVLGRLHQMLTVVLVFALNVHLVLLDGVARSFRAVPLDSAPALGHLASAAVTAVTQMFLAALQIAAPLAGVLFLVDVGLGLLTRVAPSLNAFSLAFPAKILVTLSLVGLTFPLLPDVIRTTAGLVTAAMSALGWR